MLPGFVYFFFINSHHFWHCTSTSWTEPERKAFKRHWSAANFWLATVLKERNHTGLKQEDSCLQGPQGKESSSGHGEASVKQLKICPLYPSPSDDISGKHGTFSPLQVPNITMPTRKEGVYSLYGQLRVGQLSPESMEKIDFYTNYMNLSYDWKYLTI